MGIEHLIIRPEQMRALGLSFTEQTRVQLEDHCWFSYPDLCEELGETEVARLVRVGIELATESGYETYADTLSLVELTVYWGEDFQEKDAWARRIWRASLPADRKLMALTAAASEERIREIQEEGDA